MKKNKPILYDKLIINRVKQYLEENVDKTYLDVGIMAKQLMERYPEYSRRKSAPFRKLVEQAYHIVSQSYGLESQPTSGDDSDASDLEVMDDTPSNNNLMNNMMNSLYNKPKNTPTKNQSEAIDISSDESDDGKPSTNGKTVSNEPNSGASGEPNAKNSTKRTDTSNTETQASKKPKIDNNIATSVATNLRQFQDTHQKQQQQFLQQLSNMNQNSNDSSHFPGHGSSTSIFPRQPPPQHTASSLPAASGSAATGVFGINTGKSSSAHRPRKYKKEVKLRKSHETFQDIGGMERSLKELCEILMHIKTPDIYFELGLMPPRGILLHGPPGCGKTLLARAISGQLALPLIEIPATELIAGISGESEERIRDIFEQATNCSPCVLFIDEIDAVSSNRSMAQRDMERRVVSQLITSLDNLKLSEGGQSVLVIGATTRPDSLDPALRRVGRFDHEIAIGIPTRKDRKEILTILCDLLAVEPKCDFDKIAELTPGYVGADLLALVSRAATIAVKRKYTEQLCILQAKAQSNITIVDLDDDEGDTSSAISKINQSKSDENSDIAENADKQATEAENADKPSTSTSAKTDQSPDKLPNKSPDKTKTNDKSEKETAVTDAAVVVTSPPPSPHMEVDEQVTTDGVKSKDDEPVKKKVSEETKENNGEDRINPPSPNVTAEQMRNYEPTLFELINWLDNPPDECSMMNIGDFCITLDDLLTAVKVVQPSAKREGFITVPDTTWDDIGSLHDIREELKLAVLAPVKFPEKLQKLGLTAPSGVLLCGPPGCGKTLLAKAVANEAGINFISVKGPELMNMYVGESERAVRACFQRARNSAPCVIFFDEFDSLCPKRSDGNESGSGTRIVNQLLTEMDGVEDRKGVYILAATNRPDIIDPAILRPGRLDTILYVGLPQETERAEILKATTKNGTLPVLAEDVDLNDLSIKTEGYTGADLAGLVKQASMLALRESINNPESKIEDLCVRKQHFDEAIKLLRPSVSAQDRKGYEKLRLKYAAPRVPSLNVEV